MSETKELYVKKIVYGGYGLSEVGGKKVFVRYAVPKEVVKARILKEKKDYTEATVEEVILPSSDRREAPCRYYTHCGGCQLQHMNYDVQLRSKVEILCEALERIGNIKDLPDVDLIPSKDEFNYRIKAQFKVGGGSVGFFAWASHELVSVDKCLLMHSSINELIPSLRELSKKFESLREVHVFYSPTEDEFLIKLISSSELEKEKVKKHYENMLPKKVAGVGVYTELSSGPLKRYALGREFTFIKVGDFTYRVSMDSFFQVNYTLWEGLLGEVVQGPFERALELHCGAGFFSLPLSKQVGYLLAGDANRTAVKDAEYSARINGVGNVSFHTEHSVHTLKRYASEVIDFLLVDPPRGGLSDGEAKIILQNKPRSITYVSCNPTTLARDLKALLKGGYRITSVKLVDNFPQTYHVESIVKLEVV